MASGYDPSDGSGRRHHPSCTAQWLSFEFNDPVTLSGYRITSRGLTAYAETDSPKGWALQWSVNGNPPWITVQRVTDQPTWLPLTSRESKSRWRREQVLPALLRERRPAQRHRRNARRRRSFGRPSLRRRSRRARALRIPRAAVAAAADAADAAAVAAYRLIDWGTRLIPSSTYLSSQHDTDTTSCGGGNDQCGQSTQDGDLSTVYQLLVERTAVRWWWPRVRRGRGGSTRCPARHRVDPLPMDNVEVSATPSSSPNMNAPSPAAEDVPTTALQTGASATGRG